MNYKVLFKTGSLDGSGTDADVSLIIFGSKLKTKEIILNEHKNENIFEKDKIDSFIINTEDLGDIKKVSISHNNKWIGANWYLEHLVVENLNNNKNYFFSINKWIEGNRVYNFKSKSLVNYEVELTVGTLPSSGSNSNLYLTIIGSKNYTTPINLRPYLESKEFITGHTEVFSLQNEDVGNIQELSIKSDGSGLKSDLFLSRVKIKKSSNKNYISFPFFNWIYADNEYKLLRKKVEYTVKIYTGDVAHGGTDSNVYMILIGSKRNSGTIKLNEFIARNAFEASKIDYLKIVEKDLGRIEKIKIWHDEKWLGDGWFLNKITVKNDKRDIEAEFPFYSWLDKSADPKSTNIELTRMPILPRPFYAIAHMVNTPSYAEEALDMGSNAIEFDITPKLCKDGNFSFDVFHGFRPDFDPDKINLMERSIARTDLTIYLKHLKLFEKKYENFSLVIYDCKLENVPKNKLELCGKQLAEQIVDNFYGNDESDRIFTILSIGKKKSAPFFDGVMKILPKELLPYIGFDLSMENFKTTEKLFEKRNEVNFWWGSGIASTVPKPLKHFIPQFLIAAKKRTNLGVIKKIYYWTLDDPDSMARILVTKLDGIIVNDPLKLLRVLNKDEFKHTYRLADRDDNPFEVF